MAVFVHGSSCGATTTVPPSSLGLLRGRLDVVDAERHRPLRRRVGVPVGDGVHRGDDVDEAVGRTHLGHLLAQAG